MDPENVMRNVGNCREGTWGKWGVKMRRVSKKGSPGGGGCVLRPGKRIAAFLRASVAANEVRKARRMAGPTLGASGRSGGKQRLHPEEPMGAGVPAWTHGEVLLLLFTDRCKTFRRLRAKVVPA